MANLRDGIRYLGAKGWGHANQLGNKAAHWWNKESADAIKGCQDTYAVVKTDGQHAIEYIGNLGQHASDNFKKTPYKVSSVVPDGTPDGLRVDGTWDFQPSKTDNQHFHFEDRIKHRQIDINLKDAHPVTVSDDPHASAVDAAHAQYMADETNKILNNCAYDATEQNALRLSLIHI